MRLIIAILHDTDGDSAVQALTQAGLSVTLIASTGGFLRRGNATLLIGVKDEQVPIAMQVLREQCPPPVNPGLKRATVFILKVDQFEQI